MNENKKIELTERMVEDAIRAAREQGWDEAAEWGYRTANLGHSVSRRIKEANPHRATQELPTEDGAVIRRKGERIEARHAGKTWVATEAVLVDGEWRGTWFEKGRATGDWNVMWAMSPDRIIPDTWQVADQ